ncbi:MAG: DUF1501 domain-containing protein, partial [Pseudomonadota bacterium]
MKSNPMNRRSFLKGLSYGAAVSMTQFSPFQLMSNQAFAAAGSDTRFVYVFLRGGMDALSVVAPSDPRQSNLLKKLRPQSGGIYVENMEPLSNSNFKIHPALTGVKQIYENGRLNFIHGAGSKYSTRSHFEQMAVIESGRNSSIGKDGFLSKTLDQLRKKDGLGGLAISGKLPHSLQGATNVISAPKLDNLLVVRDPFKKLKKSSLSLQDRIDVTMTQDGCADYVGGQKSLCQTAQNTQGLIDELQGIARGGSGVGNAQDYGVNPIGRALHEAAKVMVSPVHVPIVSIDMGGWDTHSDQGNHQGGRLSKLLKQFNQGLVAFDRDVLSKPQGQKVVMVIQSEFGRTAAQNGTNGTDHGRGGLMMVLSHQSRLQGPKVVAPQFDIGRLQDNRDLRVEVDYRQVLSEVLRKQFGFGSGQ